jgi:hypothetical protein
MKHVLYILVLWGALIGHAGAAVWLDSYSFPQSQPPSIWTDESMPPNYRLRAKFADVPGYEAFGFHAATSDSNHGFLLDALPPPGTYPVDLYWVKYDSSWAVVEVGTMTAVTVTVAAADVYLESQTFMSTQEPLPRIFTAANHVPFEPYKLRAKFIDPVTGADTHAATSINNHNLPLDLSPAPKTYDFVSLYWLRYDASGNSLVQVGAERVVSVTITQGTVALTSYYFTPYQRPAITTNEPMPPGQNYRLRATFLGVSGYPSGFEAATADNNNGFPLDALPPNGTYDVTFKWIKYDASWANPQPGPETQKSVTITDTLTVLNESGSVQMTPIYDGSGNIIGYSSSTTWHDFYVPIAGPLRLRTTGWVDTTGSLYDAADQLLASASTGGDYYNFEMTVNVSPGWYDLSIIGANAGDYQVIVDMVPPDPMMVKLGGDNQTQTAGQFNQLPLDVAVWNGAGTGPLGDAPVTFAVIHGGGRLATTNIGTPSLSSTLTLQTDEDGTAQVFFKQPQTTGTAGLVRAIAGGASVDFTTASAASGAILDSDGNGLPDAWELLYFGQIGADPNADSDGDGLTNLQEYEQGRNPVDFYNGRAFFATSFPASGDITYAYDSSGRLVSAFFSGLGGAQFAHDAAANLHTATSTPMPIVLWRVANNLPANGDGTGADSAILAGDGLPNLAKYAFGLMPHMPIATDEPHVFLLPSGSERYVAATYRRPHPAPSDLTYTVQVSSDGVSWASGAPATVEVATTITGNMAEVTVRDATPVPSPGLGRRIRILIVRTTQP